MIISNSLTYGEVFGALEGVTRTVGRKVNPTVHTAAEFSKRSNGKRIRHASARAAEAMGDLDRKMTSPSPLERLARPGNVLAKEPPDGKEFAGLVRTELARLKDAEGALDVDDRLVSDLISACRRVADKIRGLPAIPEKSK